MSAVKKLRFAVACATLAPLIGMIPATAEAKGCLRGAAAGAVVGHMAHHHAVAGAVVGCVAMRHHYAKKTKH